MSDDNKNQVSVSADLRLTKEDIISIRISEIEEKAELEIERLNIQIRDANKKISQAKAAQEADLMKAIDTAKEGFGSADEAVFGKLFTKVIRQVSAEVVNISSDENSKRVIIVNCTIEGQRTNDVPSSVGRYHRCNSTDHAEMKLHKMLEVPAEVLAYNDTITEINKQLVDLSEKVFEQKKVLANLSRTQRRATAALSKMILQGGTSDLNKLVLSTLNDVKAAGQPRLTGG